MTAIQSQIYTSLKTLVGTQTGYTALTHVINLSKNKFNVAGNRYGVVIRGASEAQMSTKRLTHNYKFSVILTNTYISDNLNDDSIIAKQLELLGKFELIYKEAANTKLGLPDVVMNMTGFDTSQPVVVEDDKLILIEGLITIQAYYSL